MICFCLWGTEGTVGMARKWFRELMELCGGFEMIVFFSLKSVKKCYWNALLMQIYQTSHKLYFANANNNFVLSRTSSQWGKSSLWSCASRTSTPLTHSRPRSYKFMTEELFVYYIIYELFVYYNIYYIIYQYGPALLLHCLGAVRLLHRLLQVRHQRHLVFIWGLKPSKFNILIVLYC